MISGHFELTQALVHVMSNRVREFTAFQQQNEKMMALGKLSAGLTHELNNPASAIVRDSVSLREHLRLEPETFKKLTAIQMDAKQVDAVNDALFAVLATTDRPKLSLKERTKREEEISDWLDGLDIENAYDMAESFVDFNFKVVDLEGFKSHIPDANSVACVWVDKYVAGNRKNGGRHTGICPQNCRAGEIRKNLHPHGPWRR